MSGDKLFLCRETFAGLPSYRKPAPFFFEESTPDFHPTGNPHLFPIFFPLFSRRETVHPKTASKF